MTESAYQAKLIELLERLFPGCVIVKNDSGYRQGLPDLTILYHDNWACLEVKRSERARVRPNQNFYIDYLSRMSFAAYIYPENEEEVLSALQQALRPSRRARVS